MTWRARATALRPPAHRPRSAAHRPSPRLRAPRRERSFYWEGEEERRKEDDYHWLFFRSDLRFIYKSKSRSRAWARRGEWCGQARHEGDMASRARLSTPVTAHHATSGTERRRSTESAAAARNPRATARTRVRQHSQALQPHRTTTRARPPAPRDHTRATTRAARPHARDHTQHATTRAARPHARDHTHHATTRAARPAIVLARDRCSTGTPCGRFASLLCSPSRSSVSRPAWRRAVAARGPRRRTRRADTACTRPSIMATARSRRARWAASRTSARRGASRRPLLDELWPLGRAAGSGGRRAG